MEELRNVMRVIDENSHRLPEGDYLTMCNLMRKIYNHKQSEEWTTLVDYELFDVYTPNESDDVLDHFHDYFYNISINNEETYLRIQIEYLQDELINNKPIKRVTNYVKHNAIKQYCEINHFILNRYDEEHLRQYMDEQQCDIGPAGTPFKKGVKTIYKSYIAIENTYRELYCEAIKKRIRKLYSWLSSLDDF